MLEIRAAQVLALSESELGSYIEDALPALYDCWPHLRRGSEQELRARMIRHAHAAFALGLHSRGEWLRHLNVAIALGDDFASRPRAAAILAARIPAAVRLERLVGWAEATLRGG